jgi:hypothetical protein
MKVLRRSLCESKKKVMLVALIGNFSETVNYFMSSNLFKSL